MKRLPRLFLLALLAVPVQASAQLEPIPEDRGATGLALALRKLDADAIFMHTAAHPDDEDNGLLVMMSRGRGLRTTLLSLTRGDGGQNQIGPELEEALGVLRSAELMAMHRIDDTEQYFTLAYEFGYSFSVEESLQKWGEEETLGDMVRIIRMVRPDVMVSLPLGGEGGGQHHQTSGRLTKEAFRAAADPNRFPEQIRDGLRPWQPLKLYSRYRTPPDERDKPDPPGTVVMDTGGYDPILGRSYHQMGIEARAFHLCQQMNQIHALPGERMGKWFPEDSVIGMSDPELDLFDGVPMGLDRLKTFLEGETPQAAAPILGALDELQAAIDAANEAYDANAPWKTLGPLREGLQTVRSLRNKLAASDVSESARYELEHRLSYKEKNFVKALALAHGIALDAVSDRGEVVPGGKLEIAVQVTERSPEPIEVTGLVLDIPEGWAQTFEGTTSGRLADNEKIEAKFSVRVADDAELSRPYWERNRAVDRFDLIAPEHFGLPFAPPAVNASLTFRSGSVDISIEEPVQYRYAGPWVGTEKQAEISVLPRASLALSPGVMVFPVGAGSKTRQASVSVLHKGTDEASGTLRLVAPDGWVVTPAEVPLRFQREGEATTVPFEITPPDSVAPGTYEIGAVANLSGQSYREGFQKIAYHHIETRYLFRPATAQVQALDLKVEPVRVGYIMGVGDDVADAARQLGAEVVMLEEKDLAQGDLSQFDLIIAGIRAYLAREDLRAYNDRLLDYVERGGTMLVQYNRDEWDDAQWGPYPAKISSERITVEDAPMRILEPTHPVFNFPNRITESDWKGWVQERGTYFLGERDERYRDLLASEDPWEYNAGEKRGMLVEARYGEGRWIYTGLTLFRQLPAGVPDAYKFFSNLLSLPKAAQ
ncbi:MAG TPA: PIG-L family deacetylase [Vicinamibacteria bacterium]|jgi:LmbE family N-acetylglucosaminyl deacetylase